MSQFSPQDKADTIDQLRNPTPSIRNKTWLRHKADGESGLIDLIILKGCLSIEQMIEDLSKNPNLKSKSYAQWEKRIKNHILHLSTAEGDSRNRASSVGGHDLKIIEKASGAIAFDL